MNCKLIASLVAPFVVVAEWEADREPMEGDVTIRFNVGRSIGIPITELSGRPGQPGWEKFVALARSWGYD